MAKLLPRRLNAVSAHISFSAPFLFCCYQYHRIRLCARWPSSLIGLNALALSYKGTQISFTTGQYSPNIISKFRTQIRHGGEPTISTRESYQNATVCRGTQIRPRTRVNQLVLQADWTTGTLINRRVLTMSPTETLVVAHLDLSARGGNCFRHRNYW